MRENEFGGVPEAARRNVSVVLTCEYRSINCGVVFEVRVLLAITGTK
jgi:hypothetical protein